MAGRAVSGQSRAMSALEAVTNVAVGFWIGVAAQVLVFPIFGFHAGAREHLLIAVAFTAVSLARSYALRRLFEAIRRKCERRR